MPPNLSLHPTRGGITVLAGYRCCGRRGRVNFSFATFSHRHRVTRTRRADSGCKGLRSRGRAPRACFAAFAEASGDGTGSNLQRALVLDAGAHQGVLPQAKRPEAHQATPKTDLGAAIVKEILTRQPALGHKVPTSRPQQTAGSACLAIGSCRQGKAVV